MVANRLRDAAAVLEVDSAYRRDAAIMREAADEVDRLRHDIARHVAIACELATECERLRAENTDLRNANQILLDALDAERAELAECKRDAEMMRAQRDSILLDAFEFFAWFNRHYPHPGNNPKHEWNILGMRLNAYADEAPWRGIARNGDDALAADGEAK